MTTSEAGTTDTSFGKYKLLAELGHGGMADVFLAVVAGPVGSGFSKLTVIKRLRRNLVEDPEFVTMLVDEARISARLNHPNVVQTNEVGQVDTQYFIAMEYLDGQPLHRVQYRAARSESPTISRAHQYVVVVDALAGLHHAHELADYDGTPLEIVHRDATPQNIFITYEGQVKVVDFGIAKAGGRASETKQGVVKGKVRYMAPEQALGAVVDRRVDIFCLGIVLWEIATGARMWAGREDLDIVRDLLSNDYPRSPKSVEPSVPDEIDRICQKALAFHADDRYATALELKNDIEHYLAEAGLLVEARRTLGRTMSALFDDKRAEIKQIIEHQLREMSSYSMTTEVRAPLAATEPPPGTTGSNKPFVVATDEGADNFVSDRIAPHGFQQNVGRFLKRSWIPLAIGAGVLVVGLGGALALRGPAPVATAVTHSAPEPEATIEVSLVAEPPGAVITVDERPVGNAYVSRVPRDGKAHQVVVTADGFETKREEITFDAPVDRKFSLARLPSAGTPPATRRWTPPSRNAPPRAPTHALPPPSPVAAPAPAPAPTHHTPPPPPSAHKAELDKADPWH